MGFVSMLLLLLLLSLLLKANENLIMNKRSSSLVISHIQVVYQNPVYVCPSVYD